jgi:hypothetical protein
MKFSSLLFILILLLTFSMIGCSAKPTDLIDQTEKTMQQAKAEYAEQFAPEDWRAAEQAYGEAQARLEKEKWGEASTLLLKAKTRYAKARDLAKGKREAAILEIKNIQKTAELRCKTLREEIDANAKKLTAPRKKGLEEICKEIDEKIAKVTTQLDNGQYSDAKFLAQTTMRQVWEAQKELEGYVGGAKKAS